ncbi:TonB-dependent siderophore receptor [Pedobacter sp.]|uniref:TonB-dependent siderophore receptor n=1 Tax=Pedobacter sp. TaxID=1411316 RepID=UPI00396C3EFB
MFKKLLFIFSVMCALTASAQQQSNIEGLVKDLDGKPVAGATVNLAHLNMATSTNAQGEFSLNGVNYGRQTLIVSSIGFITEQVIVNVNANTRKVLVNLRSKESDLNSVEVFGKRNAQPKGLESITRLPLKPSDQIQSISVISNKVIEEQGALTLTDAVRNIPGVTLFGSYGGVKESMSTRGFRGVPVLKNGVRMDSQFQTASGVVDMQGVESIQMIKGSAAITQGVITDLGNAGGVINVVTKTPDFINAGQVGIRAGSWGQFRPTFDVQSNLNTDNSVAIRLNGAYERSDSYRKGLSSNRVYFNPSLAWRASEKTLITIEGDYFNEDRTPVTSAVNLNPSQGVNALYVLPNDKFLGFNSDNTNTKMSSFMARVDHQLDKNFKLRAAFATSNYMVDNLSTSVSLVSKYTDYDMFSRSMSRSARKDKNTTLQLDLIGQQLYTGEIKHTLQTGIDYRIADANTTSYTGTLKALATGVTLANTTVIDTINVFGNYTNDLKSVIYKDKSDRVGTGKSIGFVAQNPIVANYNTFGAMFQDVIEFNKYLKAVIGLRYSQIITPDYTSNGQKTGSAWNPSAGVIITPKENFNVFASYTNSTSLRSEANLMSNGEKIGPSATQQFEGGIKSDWLNNRLRFNLTYFHIYTSNLSNTEYVPGTNQTTGYYFKAGDLVRDGIEAELNGRVLENLTVMLGYAYLDARYKNSPSYVNGSAPMNAPNHTGNAWVQYVFNEGSLKNLSLSAGFYYVGKRPVNEYSLTPDGHGNYGGTAPFDMPAYSTLNAQLGYKMKRFDIKLFLNNLTDEVGLNSYFRGGYINQIDPRNYAAALSYRF